MVISFNASKQLRLTLFFVKLCCQAYIQDNNKAAPSMRTLAYRRSSDPHRKKREVVYSKGLVRGCFWFHHPAMVLIELTLDV